MKLGRRIGLTLLAGVLVVQAVFAWIRYHREQALFDADLRADHALMGETLARAVQEVWEEDGAGGVDAFLRRMNASYSRVSLRWVSLDPSPANRPALQLDYLHELAPGAPVHVVASGQLLDGPDADDERLYSYTTAPLTGRGAGAIEIVESLGARDAYLLTSMRNSLVAAAWMAVLMAVMAMGIGAWYVGRPAQALIAHAQNIARGDFQPRRVPRRGDELARVGGELNRMAKKLERARTRTEAASAARLQTLEQLRHAERLTTVGRLASALAHELGTPLNVVAGHAGLISRDRLAPEEIVESSRVIGEQCTRMATLVRRVLDYARPSSAKMAPADFGELVDATVTLLEPLAAGRGVRLTVESDPALIVQLDAPRAQQVVTNVVMNAIQACSRGGSVAVVVRGAEAQHPNRPDPEPVAVLSIVDDGPGIPEESRAHVFEPFYTTKPSGEGSGLGLSISRDIVEEHGGWIAFSTGAFGTRFDVHFPGAIAA